MNEDAILLTKSGAIATITFNRPDKLNILDISTLRRLESVIQEVETDEDIRVLVVTGSGRAFIAGGDISDLNSRQGLQHYQEFAEEIHRVFRHMEVLDKPTIGAINGLALGGGVELLLTLDIRILSDNARLGLPEMKLGLFPGAGGSQRAIRQLPLCRAKELMFAGEPLTAEEAVAIGLANRVVPHDSLLTETYELASRIAAKSPIALKLLKRTLEDGQDMSLPAALRHEQAVIALVLDSQDAHEGCEAFLSKRSPVFVGK